MSLINVLPDIISKSRKEFEKIMESDFSKRYTLTEVSGKEHIPKTPRDMLARGDNQSFMKYLIDKKGLKGKLNLIYIDPPFFTKAQYGAEFKVQSDIIKTIPAMKQKAYSDTWEKGMSEYLKMIAVRLMLMRELLADDGSIFVHLDWHAVHYIKVLMDEIFGYKNFVNEIVWHYKSGGASKRRYARKHDTILFYSKTSKYYFMPQQEKSYNRGYKPYRFKGVKEYRDEYGWYTMVNRKDVWSLDMVGRTSAERTGYVTQKPETIIQRILESSTREGDLCADFFGGSGTMASAANKMNRRWITCDIGKLANINSHKRLIGCGAFYEVYDELHTAEKKGKLEADITLKPDLISDKIHLRVELVGYRPHSFENLPVKEKFLPIIERIMEEDPIQFIAYWSVDCDYIDGINRPDVYFCKGIDGIDTVYDTLGSSFGTIFVNAVDIFGNDAELIIDKKYEKD